MYYSEKRRRIIIQDTVDVISYNKNGENIGTKCVPKMELRRSKIERPIMKKNTDSKTWNYIFVPGISRAARGEVANPDWYFTTTEAKYDVYLLR